MIIRAPNLGSAALNSSSLAHSYVPHSKGLVKQGMNVPWTDLKFLRPSFSDNIAVGSVMQRSALKKLYLPPNTSKTSSMSVWLSKNSFIESQLDVSSGISIKEVIPFS